MLPRPLHKTRCVGVLTFAFACGNNASPGENPRNGAVGGQSAAAGSSGATGSNDAAAGAASYIGTSGSAGAPSSGGRSGAAGAPSLGGASGSAGTPNSGGASGSAGTASSSGASGSGGATSGVIQVHASGTCTAGQTSGSPVSSACFSSSDLAKFACVPGSVATGGVEMTVASRAQMESAVFSITYSTATEIVAYLCTGVAPDVGWLCGNPLLGSCANIADQSSCGTVYILSPMPVYTVACAK